jgi:flavin reductase (DIM6/NTAB) family NADH-FMN oxidoreductase RutF
VDDSDYRDALARVAASVVVVSSERGGGYRGLTATTFTPLSLEPPLVLVCLERWAQVRDWVAESRAFNASVLARSQEFIAERFAGRAPVVDPAWLAVPHRKGANGIPIIEGCAAWFECSLEELRPGGDHDIAIGRVEAFGRGEAEPLIHWDRTFWRLSR